MFRLGAALFVMASSGCGLAQSGGWIIVARAIQGLGAAAMIPAAGAIVINAFEAGQRGRAMGIYSGISMIFLALGPLAGGVLTQEISWRAVFWVNIVPGLAMLTLAAVTLPDDAPERDAGMDWPGAFTLVPGLVLLVLGLMQSGRWGWNSGATAALIALGS